LSAEEPKSDPTNPDSWELGQVVAEQPFKTDATGKREIVAPLKLASTAPRLRRQDRFGKKVTARHDVHVVDRATGTTA